jgi:hypothetical protein
VAVATAAVAHWAVAALPLVAVRKSVEALQSLAALRSFAVLALVLVCVSLACSDLGAVDLVAVV